MPEKTDAQKRAQKDYIGRVARVEIVMKPEKKKRIQAHAEARGERLSEFVKRAIDETLERDNDG